MKADCVDLLKVIDEKSQALKHYLDGLGEKAVHVIPAAGKWSAIMTVHHLMIAESGSVAYCQKKLSFNTELPEVTEAQIKMESKVPYMLRSPKYKAQAPPGLGTEFLDNEIALNDLFLQWKDQRQVLNDFIVNQPDDIFSKALYKHPLAGKMRLKGMLMFFDGHLDSHSTQIKNNFAEMAK